MNKELSTNLIQETIEAFRGARYQIADAIEKLYRCHQEEAWKGEYDSFTRFCEDGLGISHSTGSQYVAVYKRFCVEGRLSINRLREAPMDKLYKATKLSGEPAEQFSKALTLDRREMKLESNDDNPHQCEWIVCCKHCWKANEEMTKKLG